MRQSVLLVEDQAVIAMDIADILGEVGIDVHAIAYSLDEARDQVWQRRFDAALLALKVRGQPTFGLADWLTAWSVPTLFLTDRERGALPERHRDRPCIRMPLDGRDLAFQIARATGVFAPPETSPAPPPESAGRRQLKAAKERIVSAEMRITRLRLLISRYPTPEGKRLIELHEQSLAAMRRSRELLRGAAKLGRG